MSDRWFRLYESTVNNPKAQRLTGELFKTWINILCVASAHNGALPCVEDLAFALRLTEAEAAKRLKALIAARLIDEDETGLRPHDWEVRQFKSDVSTARVKRFRTRKRNDEGNVSSAVSETPPDTDTDTDTDTDSSSLRSLHDKPPDPVPKPDKSKRGTRLPEDWTLAADWWNDASQIGLTAAQIDIETAKFRDYWHARAGPQGVKLDWRATWRNWCRTAAERWNGQRNHGTARGQSGGDLPPAIAAARSFIA